jgi:ABC-type branched-subunit amino acid transport system substrate-binding protein
MGNPFLRAWWAVGSTAFILFLISASALAENPDRRPYVIAVLLSSREGSMSSAVEAIQRFGARRVKEINRQGGLNGVPVELRFFDDYEQGEQTKANVTKALAEPRLIGLLGLWSSSRGEPILAQVGQSGVPFISEISLDRLFRSYPNVFSLTTSVSGDVRLFKRFTRETFPSVVFIGQDDLFAKEFYAALGELHGAGQTSLLAEHWVEMTDAVPREKLDELVASIREKKPAGICLGLGSARGGLVLKALGAAGIDTPVYFASGFIQRALREMGEVDYRGALYELSNGIPQVDNERLAEFRRHPDFGPFSSKHSNDDLAYGVIYGDMLAMMVEAGRGAVDSSPAGVRAHIVAELRRFTAGQQVYEGMWRNWAFTEDRAVAQDKVIQWRQPGSPDLKLWPLQAQGDGAGFRDVPVVYLNLDMEEIRSVDSSEKTFEADFYVSLTSPQAIGLEQFEFTNACRGSNAEPLVRVRPLQSAAASGEPGQQRLYKVSGRFHFEPSLGRYPFDQQRLTISFQPINSSTPFLIQPPASRWRDQNFEIDGWTLLEGEEGGYVGYDEDIISTFHKYVSERRILPFYKFNFTWIAQRNVLDYYLRVVIPLMLILIVAYFSAFIPIQQFESVIAIQVTGLLSTIALYLAIPKLDSETATMSDQIFLFVESVIGLMIAVSILRVNTPESRHQLGRIYMIGQKVGLPLLLAIMARYVWSVQFG